MPPYRYRSSADGFTLLEALVALALLAAVVVVGLETVAMGAAARRRAAEHTALRLLAEWKLAELSTMSGPELAALAGERAGRFAAPFEHARWRVELTEVEAGSGLFVIRVEVRDDGAAIELSTYANRFGELWARKRRRNG